MPKPCSACDSSRKQASGLAADVPRPAAFMPSTSQGTLSVNTMETGNGATNRVETVGGKRQGSCMTASKPVNIWPKSFGGLRQTGAPAERMPAPNRRWKDARPAKSATAATTHPRHKADAACCSAILPMLSLVSSLGFPPPRRRAGIVARLGYACMQGRGPIQKPSRPLRRRGFDGAWSRGSQPKNRSNRSSTSSGASSGR